MPALPVGLPRLSARRAARSCTNWSSLETSTPISGSSNRMRRQRYVATGYNTATTTTHRQTCWTARWQHRCRRTGRASSQPASLEQARTTILMRLNGSPSERTRRYGQRTPFPYNVPATPHRRCLCKSLRRWYPIQRLLSAMERGTTIGFPQRRVWYVTLP